MADDVYVAVCESQGHYPERPPYAPSEDYPEYPFGDAQTDAPNAAYAAVRGALRLLALDAEHIDTPAWNPLGSIVEPGNTVVLKPNFIRDFHDTRPDEIESVITHGSIIRAVLDYVAIALKGEGRVVIADAPQCEASFDRIQAFTGLREIQAFYRERSTVIVDVLDLRPEYTEKREGVVVGHRPLPGDPAGYTRIDLGRRSAFVEVNHLCHKLYGSEYDRSEVHAHHYDDVHEYLLCKTILEADVLINLPKLKTHKKVGATLNLKNMVGITGNKNWLPHHREGVPANGGDQFASSGLSERLEQVLGASFKKHFPKLGRLRRILGSPAKRVGTAMFGDTNTDRIRSGNWHGNDTTWRMVLDLNRAVRYADPAGGLHETPQRRFFSVVDGIVAGEGNGPMGSDPKPAGLVVAGAQVVAVDLACARLMGFDYRRMPVIREAFGAHELPLTSFEPDNVLLRSNREDYNGPVSELSGRLLAFKPHFGWTGHIEVSDREEGSDLVAG